RYHNKHEGQRCFIIGNGPSLNEMDLSHLKHEICFSMNRGYLLFDRLGGPTHYHVTVNTTVIRQWPHEISELKSVKFIPWTSRRWLSPREDLLLLGGPVRSEPPRFSKDIRVDFWAGSTVTFVALQLAYFMGFSQVYLIGVDHRFVTQGEPHRLVKAEGPDRNHFAPDYFGKGSEWNLPDLETSEVAYILARHYFSQGGRTVFDATKNGALDIFPKVDYDSLFE
ncbi:MAG: hypothetical protein PVF49_02035, partial [Anaerolineales bacterium]